MVYIYVSYSVCVYSTHIFQKYYLSSLICPNLFSCVYELLLDENEMLLDEIRYSYEG
jgi:hypothetical protein